MFDLASDTWRHLTVWPPGVASRRCDVTASVLCQHQSSGICFNYVLSDKNDRPLFLSDMNRGNVDNHLSSTSDLRRRYCQQLLSLILPRCRFVYAQTFLTFLSNWSRDRIHPINGLETSCKPHVTRAYQSVALKMLE